MAKPKKRVADKWYPSPEDNESPKSGTTYPDFSRVEIMFRDADKPSARTIIAVEVSELSEVILKQAMCHGLSQKLGDGFAGADGSVDVAKDKCEAILDELKLGNWVKDREAGPRLKDLYEAVRRVMVANNLASPTDEQLDAKYKTHTDAKKNREDAKATPAIQAQLAIIEKEKADKRVAAAVAAAEAATGLDAAQLI